MRILLVDDDRVILEDIQHSVNWEKLGIDCVEVAYDANAAQQMLEAEAADIVVSDIEMPRQSGLDLLRWYRERGLSGKFLLLTSYGNFEYASTAVHLHAEEYLMKPFHVETMELVLQKMIQELQREREKEQASLLGQWMVSNIRETRLSIWSQLVAGNTGPAYEELLERLRSSELGVDPAAEYRIVLSKATDLERDYEDYNKPLVSFMLTNIQSDVLFGTPENENVLCLERGDHCVLAAMCRDEDERGLREKCLLLRTQCAQVLSATVTYCIMNPCDISRVHETFERGTRLLDRCVAFYGEVFCEEQTREYLQECSPVLQMSRMEEYLDGRDKKGFMAYLKKELEARVRSKLLDAGTLERIHREVEQAIYAHLARNGIQITLLVDNRMAEHLVAKAGRSATDMLRCENYLLDRTFAYESEVEPSRGLIDRINEYIAQHYQEDIGRNEIGAQFYLVPEYLAKLYKKKTGVSLKDYINEYRLEQARRLLRTGEDRVGEIAIEVGFENLSYFSTLFKKSTGMTPLEYRRKFES